VIATLQTALLVAGKELRSSLRDRQTLLYTVVLPFAMYPLLFWVLLQGAALLRGEDERRAVDVGLTVEPGLAASLSDARLEAALAEGPGSRHAGPVRVDRLAPEAEEERLVTGREAPLDAVLRLEGEGGSAVVFDSTRSRSVLARERVEERIETLGTELRDEAMVAGGASPGELRVLRLDLRDVSSRRDRGAYIFSLLLPMMFVFMGILGAFFPAVDVTAGEKERGTMETTCLLPVGRTGIHLGKVLAVTLAATTAASLNLLGMALAAEHLLSGLAGDGAAFEIVIPWTRLLALFPLGIVFLVTISAFLVAAASFTDTFKQGQSLLGSVQLVLLAPAFVAVMPGLELTPSLALVPVVQTVLAFRTILQEGSALAPGLLALVAVSELVYAALATAVAVHLTSRERTLLPRAARKTRRRGRKGRGVGSCVRLGGGGFARAR